MLSVLSLGRDMPVKGDIAMCVFVCMSLCKSDLSVSRYDRQCLPWVTLNLLAFSSFHCNISVYIVWKYELALSQSETALLTVFLPL